MHAYSVRALFVGIEEREQLVGVLVIEKILLAQGKYDAAYEAYRAKNAPTDQPLGG